MQCVGRLVVARERPPGCLVQRPMGAAFKRAAVETRACQEAFDRRDVLGLAAVGGAGDRQLLIGEAVVVGGP